MASVSGKDQRGCVMAELTGQLRQPSGCDSLDAERIRAADEIDRLRAALQAVRDWYVRDGSVGGCDLVIHDRVVPFTKEPDSE